MNDQNNKKIVFLNPNFPYVKKLIEQYELCAETILKGKPSAISYAVKNEIAAAEEYMKKSLNI